ncbi:MAG: response regulator transcription factor [Thermoleophilia bacterium]
MRILVVDDDRAVREALRRALVVDGHEVRLAEDGAQALAACAPGAHDCVVLDIGLPGVSGLDVCRTLRRGGHRVPILMLTARDAVSDRIEGLDAGADDYLVKPFDLGELRARLRALQRRTADDDPENPGFEEIRLDTTRHGVVVREEFVELTRTEYSLLELLLRNPRRILTRTTIHEQVWGYDFGPDSNGLRVYIGYLRKKLESAGARNLIHTVRGVGYVLREP